MVQTFWALLAPVRFFSVIMFPKRFLALTLFAALAVMPPCVLRAQWVQTNGPGIVRAGNLGNLAIDSNGSVFIGGDRGLFQSIDVGDTFHLVSRNASGVIFSRFVFNSTGDIFSFISGSSEDGIYMSTNQGENWTPSGLTDSAILDLEIDPQGLIFAATQSGEVLRSSTDGNSWEQVSSGLPGNPIRRLIIGMGGSLFATTDSNAFRSTDDGQSWTALNLCLPNEALIAFAVGIGGDVFAITQSVVDLGGESPAITSILSRSSDSGASWTRDTTALPFTTAGLQVDKYNQLYAISGSLRSTDKGVTWTSYSILGSQVGTIAFSTQGISFASTDSGSARSTDGGDHWEFFTTAGLPDLWINTLSASSNGVLFAGTEDGAFRSLDDGRTWEQDDSGLIGFPGMSGGAMYVQSLVMDNANRIFAGTERGVFRSTNEGSSWTQINVGLTDSEIYAVAVSNKGYSFAGASYGGLFRSSDGGDTWTGPDTSINRYIYAIVSDPSGNIYAGSNEGVFSSTDNGKTWTQGLSSVVNVTALTVGRNGFVYAGSDVPYRSTDHGISWATIDNGFPGLNSVLSLAADSIGNIYVGTEDQGAFLSSDNGDTWTTINSGLPDFDVIALAVNSHGLLFAGTFAGGVYRSVLSSSVNSKPEPLSSMLQSFPNPFSQSTEISFTSQAAGYAEISIVNMLGVEVARLFSGELGAGEHTWMWGKPTGLPELPDGTYECLVRMNGQVETLPVVLIR
jgi:photosystem II stability/assembly factor-like uncharacterized protein